MDTTRLSRIGELEWRLEPTGKMRVPAVIFADATLLADMEDKVLEQTANVAMLPGIVVASFAMPDAHWGYGFPIGGVAAFDPDDGVVSVGGVGFDISCGVRTMTTGIPRTELEPIRDRLADDLFRTIPAGLGGKGKIRLNAGEIDLMLEGGARWAVSEGLGAPEDLERIEEHGQVADARPEFVSAKAKERQRALMGTIGSGNHYLEVQVVDRIADPGTAAAFGLEEGHVVVTIHTGSRGLGHQINTDFLREMAIAADEIGIPLPDRELACAPIRSEIGQRYLGAMHAGINCALANREILGHLARQSFARLFPGARLELLFDVSHNTCKRETHRVDGTEREIYVHRKGATRAFGPGHPDLPEALRAHGQPVLIGGSMGTGSWILAGVTESERHAFSSAVHGAGRSLSRSQAKKRWQGKDIVQDLATRGIVIKSHTMRGVAEEAPLAYKDVDAVVEAAHRAGLAKKVARLRPLVCIKG